MLLILAVGVGAGIFVGKGNKAQAGELVLESSTSPGPDAWTEPTDTPPIESPSASPEATVAASPSATPTATSTPTATTTPTATPTPTPSIPPKVTVKLGTKYVPLYGGSGELTVCDKAKLIAFLEQNADKAKAWAAVEGITPSGIRAFVNGLVPTTLKVDTRVTNHGFRAGKATPRQSVLQAGTAILVDGKGYPRVKCRCGNPLLPAKPVNKGAKVTGDKPWPGLIPDRIAQIQGNLTDPATVNTVSIAPALQGSGLLPSTSPTQASPSEAPSTQAPETQSPFGDVSGKYRLVPAGPVTGTGCEANAKSATITVTAQGGHLTIVDDETKVAFEGSINADGTFRTIAGSEGAGAEFVGRFVAGGGIADGRVTALGCSGPFTGQRIG